MYRVPLCDTKVTRADVHAAGTPCTDFSMRGQLQGLDGKTTVHLFAWIILRLLMEEPYVIQENVQGFTTSVLADTMGHVYFFDQTTVDPLEYGWPITRVRKYTLMRHKLLTGPMSQPLHAYSRIFLTTHSDSSAATDPSWDQFMIAGPKELRSELLWACARPQSRWKDSESNQLDADHINDAAHDLDPLDVLENAHTGRS